MVCALLSCSHHVTTSCDVTYCDCYLLLVTYHVILSRTPSYSCKSNKKRKEKKRNIDNDLAILPSHDTTPLLSFLIPRIFTTHNMGQPCCLFLFHCHDLAKQLSQYLYFFSFGLTTQERVWESVMSHDVT